MKRSVTEQDMRMPEFRDAKPEELEFRADGKIVRKDRWERGIRAIVSRLGLDARVEFEISDVIAMVEQLVAEREWIATSERLPEDGASVAFVVRSSGDFEYLDGQVLGGTYRDNKITGGFSVPGMTFAASYWHPLSRPQVSD